MKCRFPGALLVLVFAWVSAAPAGEPVVGDGMKVSIEYTLTLPDKTVAGTNVGEKPLSYVHGQNQLLPALEKELAGMKKGQTKHIELKAADAYGAYDEKARVTVPRSQVPDDVKKGSLLSTPTGQLVQVLEVNEEDVVLDLNHPLAGKDLAFDVKVVGIEKAESAPSDEQKAHKGETE
ncbi:MAG: hypothetical protein KatS3mg076_0007 [Candidatus Binatia bacterium]|nr:MAG: hypothetical protein KatS3mg076_0007 [Candidatus Binatia bacterium]